MTGDKEADISDIIAKVRSYQSDSVVPLLERAFAVALQAHAGQHRVSGEDYIHHPLGVARILADLQIDADSIAAALLHDVVEDTTITLEQLEKDFGKEIAVLVDGVTKLSRIEYKSKEEQQIENYRKMFLAMAKDIRVVLIKLADRLHNMRTLKPMAPEKQQKIARETLEIFAPLAHRLGISNIKWELEDLAFRYLEPARYYELVDQVRQKRQEREAVINEAIHILVDKLHEVGIHADIDGRPKHFYSIYRKMQRDHKELSEIYDLSAVRILVDSVKDCYGALGVVHTLWKPIPNRFKDFIAVPKSNMYQSLHTTVIGTQGQPLEIQIRTFDMHHVAEVGIAAHWKYKEGAKGPNKGFDQKLSWMRQLLEWHQELRDPQEFVESVKLDVFSDEVFVFTPKGDVLDLPAGSGPLDFAYRVHTDVGHRCVGAKVNGRIVPLETKLSNGDIVEVITAKQGTPSRDWLNIVASPETRNKIRNWFKKEKREENILKGREALEKDSKRLGYEWKELAKGDRLSEIGRKMNISSEEDLMASVGFGGVTVHAIMVKLIELYKKDLKNTTPPGLSQLLAELKPKRSQSKGSHGILVKGEGGLMVRLARCCNPVPGDIIIGYITRGRGVSVHRADCPNISASSDEYERMIEVEWDTGTEDLYQVAIEITAMDRPGMLTDIMMVLAEHKINASTVNAKTSKDKRANISLCIDARNINQLENIMAKMKRVRDVYEVHRAASAPGSG
jgi:GTP diphosphokinase / guanosine-3',5'-bis(diphosphate) 3'-diphosphatase